MAVSDTVDLTNLPVVLGQNVPRVKPDGLPTREQLDNEFFQRDWFLSTTLNMNQRLTEVRSDTDSAHARVTDEVTARTNADTALAQRITTTEASVASVDARVTDETAARASADTALSGRIATAETSINGNTASISTLQQSVNGHAVRFGVQGYINGQTGGFVFTGALRNDGAVAYNMEFYSNVVIHGALLLNGTVTFGQLAPNTVTQVAVASSGGSSCAVGITTRGGPVIIQAHYLGAGYSTVSQNVNNPPQPTIGSMKVYENGGEIHSMSNNTDIYYTYGSFFAASNGAVSYTVTAFSRQQQTSITLVRHMPAGGYTYQVNDSTGGTLIITVTELVR